MKKMLSLLITITLSCTVMSTLEAKRGRSTSTPVTSKEILKATKEVKAAKTDEEKTEAAKNLIVTITDPDKTSDQQELDAKLVEKGELIKKINKQKQDIEDIDYGYFGFGTTEKQQADYIKANSELTKLNADLAVVKNEIDTLERKTGKPYRIRMEDAIKVLAGLGITAVIIGVGIKYFTASGSKIDPTPISTQNWYGETKQALHNWAYPTKSAPTTNEIRSMSWKEKFADYAKKITPERNASQQVPKTPTTNQPAAPQPLPKSTAAPTPTTTPAQQPSPTVSAPISQPATVTPPQKGVIDKFRDWYYSTPVTTSTPAQPSPTTPAPTPQSPTATPSQKGVIDRLQDWYYSTPVTTPASTPAPVPVTKIPTVSQPKPISTPKKDTNLYLDRYYQPTPASAP